VIQVQVTRRCNLRCAHCYAEAGPEHSSFLSLADLGRFLPEASRVGYSYVGVSGGEPLLWGELDPFLDLAASAGMSTSVVTNGTLLTKQRAECLKGRVGLVAVSVDGPPEDHAIMRRSDDAFHRMREGISALRSAQVPFVLVFTLTMHNAHRLPWLYRFAVEEGATGIEIHPLCEFGSAKTNLHNAVPDTQEFEAAAWLLADLVEEQGPGGPAVVFDVVRRTYLEACRWPWLVGDEAAQNAARFSDLVPSIVVEPDGSVVPFIYGFPRRWQLSRLGQPFEASVDPWRLHHSRSIGEIICSVSSNLARTQVTYADLLGEVLAAATRVAGFAQL
jgi:MoaA/NifB/PqqE/SkfB family radical SAM enzyme